MLILKGHDIEGSAGVATTCEDEGRSLRETSCQSSPVALQQGLPTGFCISDGIVHLVAVAVDCNELIRCTVVNIVVVPFADVDE